MNKKVKAVLSVAIASVLGASVFSTVGCGKGKKEAVTLMTDSLSGLFNPFYATAGTDMDVVGMTQIGMLSTDEKGNPACGTDEATVVLDYQMKEEGGNSVYTFVLKNNLVFSDGYALTMNDVLFNMYEYLDPVYTGSSTMYSIDIEGLKTYRLQSNTSSGTENETTRQSNSLAEGRIREIKDIYTEKSLALNPGSSSYSVTEAQMEEAIKAWNPTDNYTKAVTENDKGASDDAYYRQRILEDYQRIRKLFREELNQDFENAKEAYDLTVEPYKKWADSDHFNNDVFKFFYYEGMITPKYAKVNGRDDKTNIESFENMNLVSSNNTQELAVKYLYDYNVRQALYSVLDGWGTASTIRTEYAAEAKDVLLHGENFTGLEYPTITGIKSLGHNTDVTKVTVNNKDYTVAHSHDDNYSNGENKNYGKVSNSSEYDVLQITVNGTDPKAIYNFGFTVAPAHYYTADADHPHGRQIDISKNNFGVDWSSFAFQSRIIQSDLHVSVPVGAGPFVATDGDNRDNPSATGFWNQNVVYFKKNDNFNCLGSQFEVQAEKLRFQVVSSNNALDKLKSGEVDYVTPQLTTANSNELERLKKDGIESMAGWQLGYGYIGINAGKVPNVYVRRAIMAAMQTELSLDFYKANTCTVINWPMSRVNWAYPKVGKNDVDNGKPWLHWEETDKANYSVTISKIQELMQEARDHDPSTASGSNLKIKFTIAGASITEHPTYAVFKQAADILNRSDCGFEVEVVADSQALTKLATASLAVWAAAWGSTIDPDMYQVYSPYSTATSPKAWGYTQILNNQSSYPFEYDLITRDGGLSDIIDEARSINNQDQRTALYQNAMSLVLDLAVEMPVYQRQTLYAYNSKTVTGFSASIITEGEDKGLVNPYSSPLGKIWEISLVK